jgi:hypothetical protein
LTRTGNGAILAALNGGRRLAMPRRHNDGRTKRPRKTFTLFGIAVLLALGTVPASAQFATGGSGPPHVQNPDRHAHDCTCRAQGRDFHVGEKICLRTADGPRIAACDMELNNTSWRFSDQACPES